MRPSRRQVLRATLALPVGAGLGASLTGCTGGPPRPPVRLDPDDALRAQAVARETGLLTAYDAALLLRPDLATLLQSLRGEHAEHLAALTEALAQPTASPAASSARTPAPLPVPLPAESQPASRSAASLLAGLIDAERRAGAGHTADALLASRPLAALLAALSASELSHPVALA